MLTCSLLAIDLILGRWIHCPSYIIRVCRSRRLGSSNRKYSGLLCGRKTEILDMAQKLVESASTFILPNRVGDQDDEK